uniref:Uncharacterized protein n=1 Tax=Anguilla anguilla TaxID=7936 RepID=A0A0E9RS87_ANGAN
MKSELNSGQFPFFYWLLIPNPHIKRPLYNYEFGSKQKNREQDK